MSHDEPKCSHGHRWSRPCDACNPSPPGESQAQRVHRMVGEIKRKYELADLAREAA